MEKRTVTTFWFAMDSETLKLLIDEIAEQSGVPEQYVIYSLFYIRLDKKPGHLFDTVAQAMNGIVYAAEKPTPARAFPKAIRQPSSGASIVKRKYTNSRALALASIWPARS